MNINFTKENGSFNIALEGRLDTTTAPELERFIGENYEAGSTLVIDLEKLVYISSAGLRVLLSAQKRTKGDMKVKNVCDLIMEVFEMTGFVDILEIE